MTFQGYHPMTHTPRPPTPRPTLTPEPSEITAGQKRCAKLAGAQWISADGLICYTDRFGAIWRANWLKEEQQFGVWWPEGETVPGGAVKLSD